MKPIHIVALVLASMIPLALVAGPAGAAPTMTDKQARKLFIKVKCKGIPQGSVISLIRRGAPLAASLGPVGGWSGLGPEGGFVLGPQTTTRADSLAEPL
jgi:hypothetical protein